MYTKSKSDKGIYFCAGWPIYRILKFNYPPDINLIFICKKSDKMGCIKVLFQIQARLFPTF